MGVKLDGVDPEEIGAFYERETPRLVMFVATLSASLNGHAAQDIAHAAFEKALPRWATLRHPGAWLYRVAQREAVARSVAIRREVPAEALPERPGPLPAALTAEWRAEQRDVMAILQGLPAKQGQVMTWTLAGSATPRLPPAGLSPATFMGPL